MRRPLQEMSLLKVAKARFSAPVTVKCDGLFTSCICVFFFTLTDAACAQPLVLLHAPLPVVVPPLRDAVKPPHRAHLPFLYVPGQAHVHGQWGNPAPFPGELQLEALLC